MHTNDPLTGGAAPSAARTFDLMISSPPSRCSQCAEYSLRISDLETRLTLAKRQAQMAFDKANKTSSLTKQVSILDDKVSSLMAKILHHEECNSFLLGIIESAYEMLRCKFPFDLSFSLFAPLLLL
jgi:predicted component of type VI protein secretion system